MPDVSPIRPLPRLTFPGFNFLALRCLVSFTFVTAYSPLSSRIYSGFFYVRSCGFTISGHGLRLICVHVIIYPVGLLLFVRTAPICILIVPVVLSLSDFGNQCLAPTPRPASPRLQSPDAPTAGSSTAPASMRSTFCNTTEWAVGRHSIQSHSRRGSKSCHPSKARLHLYTAFRIVEYVMRLLDDVRTPRANSK